MPAAQREHPYIWATWLPRLLTGENSCEWAIWFKAHYQDWPKVPSAFDQAQWLLDHTALLNEQKAHWETSGYDVFVERQNSFQLRGQSATLAGKPDLLVVNGDHARIIDLKSGREQPWHTVQIKIYQWALHKALPQYRLARLAGEVVYPTHTVRVPRGALPAQFTRNVGSLISRLAADQPPDRIPSGQECLFCDITAADCPERVDHDLDLEHASTDDF